MQQPTQPTPAAPQKTGGSKAGIWLVVLLVIVVIAVVIWYVAAQ